MQQRLYLPRYQIKVNSLSRLEHACVINLDTITTNAKKSLQERLVTLSPEKIKAVEAALHFALGLEE